VKNTCTIGSLLHSNQLNTKLILRPQHCSTVIMVNRTKTAVFCYLKASSPRRFRPKMARCSCVFIFPTVRYVYYLQPFAWWCYQKFRHKPTPDIWSKICPPQYSAVCGRQ